MEKIKFVIFDSWKEKKVLHVSYRNAKDMEDAYCIIENYRPRKAHGYVHAFINGSFYCEYRA